MKKPRKRPTCISARGIEIVDSSGRARIFLNGGKGDGHASIAIYGNDGLSIQISVAPKGQASVGVIANNGETIVAMGINPELGGGMSIIDGKRQRVTIVDDHGCKSRAMNFKGHEPGGAVDEASVTEP